MNVREGVRRLGLLLGGCGAMLGFWVEFSSSETPPWKIAAEHRKFESLMKTPTMQKVIRDAATARPLVSQIAPDLPGTPPDLVKLISEARAANISDGDIFAELSKHPVVGPQIAEAERWGYTSNEILQYLSQRHTGQESSTTRPDGQARPPGGAFIPPPPSSWQGAARDESWKLWRLPPPPPGYVLDGAGIPGTATVVAEDANGGLLLLKTHPLLKENRDRIDRVHLDAARTVVAIDLSSGESIQKVEAPHLNAYLSAFLYPILGFLLPWGCVRILSWVGSGFVA
jgi:hypothetical protein